MAFQPTAANCYRWGIADAVVPEPPGGAHRDHDEAARLLGGYLTRALRDLRAQSPGERRRQRRDRYRRIGAYREFPAGDPAAIAAGRLDATTNGTPSPTAPGSG
jgi:acetyl-CoA carboxylase alpha subunit